MDDKRASKGGEGGAADDGIRHTPGEPDNGSSDNGSSEGKVGKPILGGAIDRTHPGTADGKNGGTSQPDTLKDGRPQPTDPKTGKKLWDGVHPRYKKGPKLPKVSRLPEDVEDCVACQFVWKQVEQDVGNSAITQTIYDSFNANAQDAQRTPLFYPAVQNMFDAVDDMITDYMEGYTVNQICENSMICRPRNLDAFVKWQRRVRGV